MPPYLRVLVLLIGLVLTYEFIAVAGHYPTISTTVGSLPWWAVIAIAVGLAVLAYHFIRMKQRAQR